MKISKIEISNFKSFKNLKLTLSSFNVLIGPNGAGKSNFLEVFKFIRDIISHGLDNAISMQGEEYLRNIRLLDENDTIGMKFEIAPTMKTGIRAKSKEGLVEFRIMEMVVDFAIVFGSNGGHTIKKDVITQKFELYRIEESRGRVKSEVNLGRGYLKITNRNGNISFNMKTPLNLDDIFKNFLHELDISFKYRKFTGSLLIEHQLFFIPILLNAARIISGISIYDFDPSFPKLATSLAGKAELEENGSNLAIVLRRILADDDKKRMLFNLMQEALPFIENVHVEKFLDKYLQIMFRETYSKGRYLPAFSMSEGTIFIIDIIIALYFEDKPLIIFEEPERRIHPYLISKIVDMMEDAASDKQIIVSTHNAEMVKHATLENILLVTRDEEGFSQITKPSEKNEIQAFLQNDLGIEDLFVQNILGI